MLRTSIAILIFQVLRLPVTDSRFFWPFFFSENSENLSSIEGAVLQQALSGESFLEQERRLSEMILHLQKFREQLVSKQDQHNKVSETLITY